MSRKVSKENTSDKKGRDFYADAISAGLVARPSLTEATVHTLANQASSFNRASYLFFKRSFDILAGIVGCIFLLPILLGVKIANMLTGDFAPIILKQQRLGQYGKTFTFYKIRSMVTGKNGSLEAQNLLEELFEKQPELREEYEKNHKLENDPRVTKVGKFIRKTSLDEFPQFINVLKGDISLIGNRPYLPAEEKAMGAYYDTVLSTKSGIISWWAVNGRSDVDFKERLKLEEYYSEHQNTKMDMRIVFRVIKMVFKKVGAK